MDAEERAVPIYVLRSNTVSQIEQALVDLFNLAESPGRRVDLNQVEDQVQTAINAVQSGQRWVDLPPAPARVRRLQHEIAREAELVSHSYGKDPNRHVRIFRE
jgi:predicted RNA-binding protein Jag